MILEFDVDGRIGLKYNVDGGVGYDDLAEEAITLRNYDLNIFPLLKNIVREKFTLLSYLYNIPEDNVESLGIVVNRTIDGNEFKIFGTLTFDIVSELPKTSDDVLISRLIEYIENKLAADIEDVIDVEPLQEMVNHDHSIDFRIDGVHGIGANVIETRWEHENRI